MKIRQWKWRWSVIYLEAFDSLFYNGKMIWVKRWSSLWHQYFFVWMRPVTLLKRRLWHRYLPVNFCIISRTLFFIEHFWWLILGVCLPPCFRVWKKKILQTIFVSSIWHNTFYSNKIPSLPENFGLNLVDGK